MSRICTGALAIICLSLGGPRTAAAQPRQVGGVGITVFADQNFRGKSASFRNDVSDLRKYGMNDVISSLQVARGETWEVCVDKDYKGRCQVFSGSEPDLSRTGWSGVISSMRRVRNTARGSVRPPVPPGPPRPPLQPQITFYDQPGFRGHSKTLTGPAAALAFFNNRAGSIRVSRGAWEVCDGTAFKGRCLVVSRDVPDLRRFGLDRQISSARPR